MGFSHLFIFIYFFFVVKNIVPNSFLNYFLGVQSYGKYVSTDLYVC